jgi:hypothetical protein
MHHTTRLVLAQIEVVTDDFLYRRTLAISFSGYGNFAKDFTSSNSPASIRSSHHTSIFRG